MGKGIGYKVLTKKGLSAPFMKSSVLKAIEMGLVPLKARLYDMEAERYVMAADLVGEELDKPGKPAEPDRLVVKVQPGLAPTAEASAKGPTSPEKKALKLPKGKQAPKAVNLPKPRRRESEVDAITAAADTQHGTAETRISPDDIAAASAAAQPKPNSKDAKKQANEVGQLTDISGLILVEDAEPKKDPLD